MTNKYFQLFINKKSVQELKQEYRRLILKYHPDKGGSKEETQLINVAYEEAYKIVESKEKDNLDQEGKDNFKEATSEDIKEFIEIINALMKMGGVEIEIVGAWVWLSGNTYEHKEEIKKLNFRYSKKHKKWYYFKDIEKTGKRRGSRKTYKQITREYGVQKVSRRLAIQ